MTATRTTAIELLMSHPDSIVAEMLGVRLATLRRWIRDPHFARLLQEREGEQKASAARIARQALINAAAALCQVTSDPAKPDAKVLLEVLKVGRAFENDTIDPAEALAQIIGRASAQEVAPND